MLGLRVDDRDVLWVDAFIQPRADLFDGVSQSALAPYGETRIPGLADLFVATMKGTYA